MGTEITRTMESYSIPSFAGEPILLKQLQEKAVALVFYGRHTNEQIAAEVGKTVDTIYRWKRMPEFKEAVATYGLRHRVSAYNALEGATIEAAETLIRLLKSKDEKVQVRAATEILEMMRVRQIVEIKSTDDKADATDLSHFIQALTLSTTLQQDAIDVTPDQETK